MVLRPHQVVATPRPTVFLFAVAADVTIDSPTYNAATDPLRREGWLIVSMDPPAHGEDARAGESPDLTGWAQRVAAGQPLVEPFVTNVSRAIDSLIATKQSDPTAIFAVGISRGGFLALHLAAVDHRVRGVVAMMPVTDLRALLEFRNVVAPERYLLTSVAGQLSRTPLYVRIAEQDGRVSTEACQQFVNTVEQAGGTVDFHMHQSREHTMPDRWGSSAAQWLRSLR
jgi:esterase FrsA